MKWAPAGQINPHRKRVFKYSTVWRRALLSRESRSGASYFARNFAFVAHRVPVPFGYGSSGRLRFGLLCRSRQNGAQMLSHRR